MSKILMGTLIVGPFGMVFRAMQLQSMTLVLKYLMQWACQFLFDCSSSHGLGRAMVLVQSSYHIVWLYKKPYS